MPQFNFPGNQSPGGAYRAAPYSRTFTGAAVLTSQVGQAPNATSGALLFVTTATPTFAYKDSSGATVTLSTAIAGAAVGSVIDFAGVAMTEITTLTNATLLAYWHGTAAQ